MNYKDAYNITREQVKKLKQELEYIQFKLETLKAKHSKLKRQRINKTIEINTKHISKIKKLLTKLETENKKFIGLRNLFPRKMSFSRTISAIIIIAMLAIYGKTIYTKLNTDKLNILIVSITKGIKNYLPERSVASLEIYKQETDETNLELVD